MTKFDEFVQSVIANNEKVFGQMPPNKVRAVVRTVLEQMATEIGGPDTGEVVIPKLGKFIIKQVTPEGEATRKRIIFRPLGAGKAAAPQ